MLKWFWTIFSLGAPVLYPWPPIKVPNFSLSKTHNLMESLVDHQRRQNFFCPDGFIIFHSFYSLVNHMAWSLRSLFVLPLLTVYEEHSLTACIYTYQYLEFACNISSFLRTISVMTHKQTRLRSKTHWKLLLYFDFHSYFEATSPNCFKCFL